MMDMESMSLSVVKDLTRGDVWKTSADALNAWLKAYFYDDLEEKCLTHSLLKVLAKAKEAMNEGDALFTEAIRLKESKGTRNFEMFDAARAKGCRHPLLYHFLGNCYHDWDEGVRSYTTELRYYVKAISGTP